MVATIDHYLPMVHSKHLMARSARAYTLQVHSPRPLIIDDSLNHGMGRNKAIAYAAVKDVIENGILLDYNTNHKGRGYDSAVIAAPIEIAGERYICQVVIKRSKKKNRFYLHEVTLQKNLLDDAFVTNLAQKPASQRDLTKVLQNIITTSDNASKIVDEIAATLPTKTKAKTETKTIRFRSIKETAPETASVLDEHQPTVVSSADGTKILKNIDNAIKEYENKSSQSKTIIGDIAKALGAKKHGSNSQYATFEAVNGKVFTIRLANHNTKVSTFDNHNESEGISIVISPATNTGTINDGDAHIVEYFYNAIKLRKADGKPLVEILKSIKQSLYSGQYIDTTGLAEREEVNKPTSFRSINPD